VTTELTSSVRAAGPILQVLAEGGVNLGQVGARLGIDPTVFADQDARIPISKLVPLWDVAEELLDDAFVGLHVAQRVSRETFDIFSYIACASANLARPWRGSSATFAWSPMAATTRLAAWAMRSGGSSFDPFRTYQPSSPAVLIA